MDYMGEIDGSLEEASKISGGDVDEAELEAELEALMKNMDNTSLSSDSLHNKEPQSSSVNVKKGREEPKEYQNHLRKQTLGSKLNESKPVKSPMPYLASTSSSSRGASASPHKNQTASRPSVEVRPPVGVKTARSTTPVKTASTLNTPLKNPQLKSGSANPLISGEHEHSRARDKDKKNTPKKELSTFYY
mmetsp:Transcript_31713/g.30229  ORF Transcript_31713/g.30229 Transcript_31713/m.30229 type:complete len:190 (-) Transcript_31713:119-688(-)|eukprot:CAMPEP_0119034764 /NCGR_PEP_ID=MMETSP1177-20130426/1771_1 /TAXON_ID=2985 /ORGANISM="Ochromonas sp, Strain CCMP1899" /LENGTH=189 /DNA_ID=CAMNT_0006992451 /DNA_START=1418 /DNA_END=1987 /DNA_ORIENTATION=+